MNTIAFVCDQNDLAPKLTLCLHCLVGVRQQRWATSIPASIAADCGD